MRCTARGNRPFDPLHWSEHMPRRCIALAAWGQAEELESGKFRFKKGEISFFGKLRPYFHKVGVAVIDGICSTDILVVTPQKSDWFGFLLGHISSVEFVNHTDAASSGTKMPRTNWNDMARYRVALPPESLARSYSQLVQPFIERIGVNILGSRTLVALRDALLPKLLSGEIRVKESRETGRGQSPMKSINLTLGQILTSPSQYVIPAFQRYYRWDQPSGTSSGPISLTSSGRARRGVTSWDSGADPWSVIPGQQVPPDRRPSRGSRPSRCFSAPPRRIETRGSRNWLRKSP